MATEEPSSLGLEAVADGVAASVMDKIVHSVLLDTPPHIQHLPIAITLLGSQTIVTNDLLIL